MSTESRDEAESRMVDAKRILEIVWDEPSRPSIAWLRQHTGKDIPAVKIGRLYFYCPAKVRAALSTPAL